MNIYGIDIKKLNKAIDAYSSCTDIPVTVFDKDMNIVTESMKDNKFCKFFHIYTEDSICKKNLAFSSKTSYTLGEPYIFVCPSGLLNIVVAIIVNRKYEGSIVAGPIAMEVITEKNICKAIDLNSVDPSQYMPISIFVRDMKIFSLDKINKLSLLLYNNILSLYSNIEDYEFMRNKQKIQNNAGRKIHEIKNNMDSTPKIKNIREEIINKIVNNDTDEIKDLLDDFLNDILQLDACNFEIMKVRIFELYLMLSMTAIKNGISLERIFDLNLTFIENLNKVQNIKDLSECSQEVVSFFCDNIFTSIYSGNSKIIKQSLFIIENNYMNKITLQDLADHFNLNVSYLSKLFKKELNACFSDYINRIRIEKSLGMIRDHQMSISEIATAVGFKDQSYFTKQFKKEMGESPKKYSMNI
ncbi:AraC-type DNA-binding protein [Dethiosulfatibacter aminovorans DSM 17477]|uniref:AraC-type DNA-binding protein n=1 Tax=Dethiosulfatibacter aminovorans DSM 17477 TaxID=1121476 RepID=A0A1M6LJ87_9FIRM|nr:PocR ligand-binding domain-containing protein [Dethiosulfatibacter aminovorans]SHJ71276.1 AraC-type DNA-binding protein [Dethiosulfatibacter aminovorans DSM 17477]